MKTTASTDRARRFASLLMEELSHETEFEFDLMSFEYEPVKLVLETHGYSVHKNRLNPRMVKAVREEPDRSPVNAA